jgi:hypothetical protein
VSNVEYHPNIASEPVIRLPGLQTALPRALEPRRICLTLVALALACASCRAQATRDASGAQRQSGQAGAADAMEVGPGARPDRGPKTAADSALAAMAEEMLPRLERMSGLSAQSPIRFARRTRDQLHAYLVQQLNQDMPPRVMHGVEGVYGALGLIPDTLDLRRLLLNLYTEQVLGFYDPHSKVLYVMNSVPSSALKTVLAHEMVHALQDQHTNLDSLVSGRRDDDERTAAQAAVEGQATLVMFREMLHEATGRDVPASALPDLGSQIEAGLAGQETQFAVFKTAPKVIQESLVYPYAQGASFVQDLWRHHPDAAPLDSLLPLSTEQVSHPETRFFGHRDDPLQIVFPDESAQDRNTAQDTTSRRMGRWDVAYENTLGQDLMGVLLETYLGPDGGRYDAGWAGDRYRLLSSHDRKALLWYSVWDDTAAADSFAAAYRRVLKARPERTGVVQRLNSGGHALVRIVDAPRGVDPSSVPAVQVVVKGVGGRP